MDKCRKTMSASKLTSDKHNAKYSDGVRTMCKTDRWQKGSEDRLYPDQAESGYVDLAAGEVVDLVPRAGSQVKDFELSFNAAEDCLELIQNPTHEVARKCNAEPKTIAKIPTKVLA
jgi:hypothetical protein